LEQGIIEGENPVCDLRSSGLVSTSWRVTETAPSAMMKSVEREEARKSQQQETAA